MNVQRFDDEDFDRELDEYPLPIVVEEGIRCGNHGHERVYHQTTSAVRACYRELKLAIEDMAARQAAEIYAENAWLRAAENSGEDEPPQSVGCSYGPPPGY